MDLNWLQSLLFGFVSGLMDILPVSAQAHRVLLLKFFGVTGRSDLFSLMIHLGVLAGLYFCCHTHIVRMSRAKRLSRIPKRRRKRPLDVRSLMDVSLLRTMLIPAVACMIFYDRIADIRSNLLLVALFLFLNGILLYVPQFFPTGNRDSRNLSRVEGLLMGLGGGASVLPGISAVGAAVSVGSVCGVDRAYALTMALLMNLFVNLGYAAWDIYGILGGGAGELTFMMLVRYLVTALTAFGGTVLGVRIMRYLTAEHGCGVFGLYCFGLSLFTFILNLLA